MWLRSATPIEDEKMRSQFASFGEELAACDDVSQVLDVVARRAAVLVGEGSVLTIVSDDGTTLHSAAFHHDDPEVLAAMREALAEPLAVGTGLAGAVASQRTPLVLAAAVGADLAERVAPASQSFAQRYPIRALMIVPMVGYGEVVGTLGVVRVASDEPYSTEALLALEALADRAGLTLAEARRAPRRLAAADYEAIFRHSVDGVLFTMPDGRILAANPAACEVLRRSERDICRAGRQGLVVDDERARAAVATRAETGHVRSELTMRRGDGSQFVADVSSTVFTDGTGEVRACVTFRDVSDQVRLRADLEHATHALARLERQDELTKLRNRRGFVADASQALAIADRSGAPVQLVSFDVDGLERVNVRHGHEIGDEVLKTLAAAIATETRASDVTARLGGDEFAALLFGASAKNAEKTVQRIALACRNAPRVPAVRFSHGMVERASGSPSSLDRLLHEADQRMHARRARSGIAPDDAEVTLDDNLDRA